MKKNTIISLLFLSLLAGTGCRKYVDKGLPDQFDDLEFWKSEDNVRSYNWGFYELFPGFGNGATFGDFYFTAFSDDQASPTFQNFPLVIPATSSAWDFTQVRKANIMLERIDLVPMSDEAKKHWKGVARFFRALVYFQRVKDYGDVPWVSQSLSISDKNLIYKPRDPRAKVMDSVLADINFAIDNIRANDGANNINKNVALALKSRICLYEGTYRKYHKTLNIPDADKYLEQCRDASEKLMNSGYSLSPEYKTTYSSLDLGGNPEVILYKRYVPGFLTHSVIGYNSSSTVMSGLTKSAIDAYLCSDGLPIGLSPLYKGDSTLKRTRTNRDKRLLQTIDTVLCYNGSLVEGRSSSTGYRPAKFLNPQVANVLAPLNDTDAPLFWLSEILLNYAEACAELDQLGKRPFGQGDLDRSVNLLRVRAALPPLTYAGGQNVSVNGNAYTDPKKDADVPSLIWEIRRERRVELMMDGFRYQDLMRWSKGDYMTSSKNPDIFRGARVPSNDAVSRDAEGYITPYKTSVVRTFVAPKNYLQPVPSGQISLYPNGELTQNPGWF